MILAQTKFLSYQYPSGIQALKDINLEINFSESIALMGENGAGKTTLIKTLVGLLKPTSGDVFFLGKNTRSLPMKDLAQDISVVTQNPDTQIFEKTVYDEVAYALKNFKIPPHEIEERVIEELTRFDLLSCRRSLPTGLSGGERKRVVFASATAMRPKLYLLDEPTRGLDQKKKIHLALTMNHLQQQGATIIYVTHDLEFVAANPSISRTIIMKDGQILQDGLSEKILRNEAILTQSGLYMPEIVCLSKSLEKFISPTGSTVDHLVTAILERVDK
ncbi:MAG: energy-coupling factor ABC transporter ATP-binding protein [Candidatus Ranarchaeia archaeon]|jgi:energy-coupling factor transporter ATP-binding protein EcfA2